MIRDYLPILLQAIVAVGFAASALIVSVLLGKVGKRSEGQGQRLRVRHVARWATRSRASA